jgi:predicted metal-dependent hydrolase
VEVRRSARRRRTVTAFRENGKTVVVIPASLSAEEEAAWVERMLARIQAQENRLTTQGDLADRAAALSARYFGGRARPASVRWVTNQNGRWGSCTPSEGTIRLSHRLQGMPEWVIDSVLVHELAHLIESGHGPRFQALVRAYPEMERARGFLAGVVHAQAHGLRRASLPGGGEAPDQAADCEEAPAHGGELAADEERAAACARDATLF